jgi:hypothetical protein
MAQLTTFDFTVTKTSYAFSRDHAVNFDLFLVYNMQYDSLSLLGSNRKMELQVSHVNQGESNQHSTVQCVTNLWCSVGWVD